MKCPECKEGELKEHISIKGFFKKVKEIIYFCPFCSFENKKEFKLSREDLQIERFERENKPKEIIQRHLKK